MLEDGKIDGRQVTYLNVTYIIATALLGVPTITARFAGQDAWICSLLATLIGLAIAWLTAKIGSLFPGKTLIQYLEEIVGRWPGKLLGLLYLFFFIHICSVMIREFADFLVEAFLPETPLIVFGIVVIALAAYTIKQGLEVLARVNQVFLPLILLSVVSIILLAAPEMDFKRLLPVFDSSIVDIFKGSLAPGAWCGEIIALAMLIPFLNKPGEAGKTAFISILVTGLIFIIITTGSLATFGPLISSMTYPFFNISRIINIAKVIDRVDPLVMAIWITGGFVKITFFYYVSVLGSAQWLKLKSYRPLVFPIGVILVSLSIAVGDNTLEIFHFIAHVFPFYGLLFEAGIPLVLLIIALFRKQGGNNK